MPCLSHTAKALGGLTALDADGKLLAAAMEDARATLKAVFRALCEDLRTPEAVRQRIVQVLTRLGWVGAEYPYAPGKVTGRQVAALLCGPEQAVWRKAKGGGRRGLPKATREARRVAAEAVASLGSVDEAQRHLARDCGMDAGRETERRIALEAGRRTRKADAEGRLEARPRRKWKPPEWAVPTTPTLLIEVDGKAFPCRKRDLRGRRGRDGGKARTRNANVAVARWYRHVDASGRPVFEPRSARYRVTGAGGMALGGEVRALALEEGLQTAPRAEYATDGENELDGVYGDFLANIPGVEVVRVLDAMHACGYVDALVKALEKDDGKARERSRRLRRRLVDAGWEGFAGSFHRAFGKDAEKRLGKEGRKAWDYLWKRRGYMDYRGYRLRHLVIGTGMVESGCKMLVGSRLVGPGMRWRYENGLCIAALRAAMRSHLEIAM